MEPWEKGSRKTAGQTGMCGGVSRSTCLETSSCSSSHPLCLNKRTKGDCLFLVILSLVVFDLQVRGVGTGGIVSTAFCLLYKLFTLKLTRKQVMGLITHTDSPYIRALGFMYIRYYSELTLYIYLSISILHNIKY